MPMLPNGMREYNRQTNVREAKALGVFIENVKKRIAQELAHLEPLDYRAHLADTALKYWVGRYTSSKREVMGPSYGLQSNWRRVSVTAPNSPKMSEMGLDVGLDVDVPGERAGRGLGHIWVLNSVVKILAGLGVVFLITIPTKGWLWDVI